ncbi:DnaD domain-containing protein [Oceanobacillus bengalensis]|uniref:DnaD domain protein n=1 Tax=Oceanobacillus bengalensis TaxID=1435466 RepID=A0A494YV03_9BACI|nr:DnaD domain-containing protein [Oceanobacillus bengalensis]RKQ13928.1 DnaD domain protein [Oceanobacillus bengalensis]
MTKFSSFQQILLSQLPIPTKLLTDYVRLGLNETEVLVVLQLLRFFQVNKDFPTPFELAQYMTIDEKECANILRKLIQKNILTINQSENEQNQLSESYSLNALLEKLYEKEPEVKQSETEQTDGQIFLLFEQEFARPLSPFEIETINAWLDDDKIAPSLIKAGLRESVLMGKLNFKYIDRILREWKKKGIHSVEQAREASKQFHNKSQAKVSNQDFAKKRDTSFYYNWLEGED